MAWFPFHAMRATRRGFNNVETLVRKARSLEIGSSALPGHVIRKPRSESATLVVGVGNDRLSVVRYIYSHGIVL
jgi:predicted amidophosphoribosyltransferase